jgi:hypothetical protein
VSALRAAVWAWLVASLVGLAPARAFADDPHGPDASEARRALSAGSSLTLRPEPALRSLAERAARVLATRTGVIVAVGEPPPSALLEAVPEGHVAIAMRADAEPPGELSVVLAGREATFFDGRLRVSARPGASDARSLAIAIEALRDVALATVLPSQPPQSATGATVRTRHRVRLRPDGFPWSRYGADRLPLAKPTIYLRALLGLSTARSTWLIGPGTGLGLCISRHCVVLEGDLPLLPEERANAAYRVRYRFLNFSVRFQYRPFQFGPFVPGLSFGVMTRIGTASLVGTDRSQTVTDIGLRATLEAALRLDRRFEVVLEGGVDLALSRARFINRAGDVLALEDQWTPWIVTGLRLRP